MLNRTNAAGWPAKAPRLFRAAITILAAGIAVCGWGAGSNARAAESSDGSRATVPEWVFPANPVSPDPPSHDDKPQRVPHSNRAFMPVQLKDLFAAVDWFPQSHSVMPDIVARGRSPDVYACGYCHTPSGQGRPENASLAGLPAAYIIQQVADFKSGARLSASHSPYLPTNLMIQVAKHVTADELASAATYFSQQRPEPRVQVVERSRVPRPHVVGWVYAAESGEEDEALGQRLLEFTPDATRHENRDDRMRYIAYVPKGSRNRGLAIATAGAHGLTTACISCHGPELQGVGAVPRIAGRSPTYLLRQLLAFQTGARAGDTGEPMRAVVAKLRIGNMIDVAAYAASLPP